MCSMAWHDQARATAVSADEVYDDQMQDEVGEEEVGKGALGRDVCELGLVLGVYLDAQRDCAP